MGDDVVQAAGGVVRREGVAGVEILLVHRPKYDDWTFPKGKLERGELHADGALREVEEETGLRCVLGTELSSTSYVDHRGRLKLVRYWLMTVDDGAFAPCDEVDEIRWLPPDAARAQLSYDHDRALVDAFELHHSH